MAQQYNSPPGTASDIGPQLADFYYYKKALIEIRKDQYFMPLADVRSMPAHMGKTIKQFFYIPLLDDRNVNDQGIDASGAVILPTQYSVQVPLLADNPPKYSEADATVTARAYSSGDYVYDETTDGWYLLIADRAIGSNLSTADTATTNAAVKALIDANANSVTSTVDATGIDVTGQDLIYASQAAANIAVALIGGTVAVQRRGNLQGSSRDIGTTASKLPTLSETGGRVNRVGNTRITLEGTIEKFGFFSDYTEESMAFDSDSERKMHLTQEALVGANELTEAALAADIINGAGTERFAGGATSNGELSGETGNVDVVTYTDLAKLSIDLDNNRCPKKTTVISGTRMTDTRTIPAARPLFIGSELELTMRSMKDLHGDPAFISYEKYAAGAQRINDNEIGSIGQFRVIVNPEMPYFQGAGAREVTNDGYRATGGKYDVFPMVVVGSGSFTTIGFQTNGKTVKFSIIDKPPGKERADSYNDPYGEIGFYSIKWYYGSMMLRPEWIAVMKTVAPS